MPLISCQVMKDNQMQCSNPAFARFITLPFCLLHLNEQMNVHIKYKTLITEDQVELINPTDENKAQLTKIIDFTNTAITNAT